MLKTSRSFKDVQEPSRHLHSVLARQISVVLGGWLNVEYVWSLNGVRSI